MMSRELHSRLIRYLESHYWIWLQTGNLNKIEFIWEVHWKLINNLIRSGTDCTAGSVSTFQDFKIASWTISKFHESTNTIHSPDPPKKEEQLLQILIESKFYMINKNTFNNQICMNGVILKDSKSTSSIGSIKDLILILLKTAHDIIPSQNSRVINFC